jgi:hypothetical protein
MPQCITCGCELHPERARKYNYCMARECQDKNAQGLTMVAVGVNKAAEQYLILDEQTREELASGKYRDQRRGFFGPLSSASATAAAPPAVGGAVGQATGPAVGGAVGPAAGQAAGQAAGGAAGPAVTGPAVSARPARRQDPPARRSAAGRPARRPWSKSQERLALLYNQQGLRPDEIARKLRLSPYLVTQIILASRSQGKL